MKPLGEIDFAMERLVRNVSVDLDVDIWSITPYGESHPITGFQGYAKRASSPDGALATPEIDKRSPSWNQVPTLSRKVGPNLGALRQRNRQGESSAREAR